MLSYAQWVQLIYCNMQDHETVGYLNIINDNVKNRMILPCDLIDYDVKQENIYFTLNTFKNNSSRKISNLSRLQAFFIDLDSYHIGMDINSAIAGAMGLAGKEIPYPTLTVRSGQGAYLIWLIDPVDASHLPIWNKIQNNLHDALKCFGSDRKSIDASRVLRVPSSINGKPNVNKEVYVDYYNPDAKYFISDFIDWFDISDNIEKVVVDKKAKAKTKTKGISPKKTQKHQNDNSEEICFVTNHHLVKSRLNDIERLLLSRKENIVGSREQGLFLFRHFLTQLGFSFNEALEKTLELNRKLYIPLSKKEVVRATKAPNDKYYKYKTNTIIKMLKITPEEQESLTVLTSYSNKKLIRWAKTGRTISRTEETQQKIDNIYALKLKGYNVADICKTMNISRTTYYNLINGRKKKSDKIIKSTIVISPMVYLAMLKYSIKMLKVLNNKESVNLLSHINNRGQGKALTQSLYTLVDCTKINKRKCFCVRAGPVP